jgi:hypothetical protein
MKILSYIARNVIDDENSKNLHFFPYGYGNYIFLPMESEIITKFEKLNMMVIENGFLDAGQKTFYISTFGKIQKVYWGLKKFINLWRIRRGKISSMETDLYLNSLRNFPIEQKTKIYQCGMIYEFRLTDIMKIWCNSLSLSVNFSPTPRVPKNPYLNIDFNKGHMFHFYMCIRDNAKFAVPLLIEKFIKMEMNIFQFKIEYYTDLMEPMIHNYIDNTGENILFFDIVNMISSYKKELRKRNISRGISSKDKINIINTLKPVLKIHLISIYSCNPIKRGSHKNKTINKLRKIFKNNPTFGRKIVTIPPRNSSAFVFSSGSDSAVESAVESDVDSEIDNINNVEEWESTASQHMMQDSLNETDFSESDYEL